MSIRIKEDRLRQLLKKLFEHHGLSKEDARIVSECLICAEMAGISTHGIRMATEHIKKCNNGYDLITGISIEKETNSFAICNANNSIGMVSAWKCMDMAIKKSELHGMYTVFCNNANTFSAAYCYAKYAVENGKIALIMCNSPAQMAPLGGCEKLLGTNPLAIGVPALKESPFILDMATSAVAKSRINEAIQEGKEIIPFGWATDNNGNPTNNPKEAVSGLMLPMAGAKGYGLAMAIDIISGFLLKSAYLDNVGRFYSKDNRCMNVGHTFIVIDPIALYGSEFYADMDMYLNKIRNSKTVRGEKIYVPGDLNYIHYKKTSLDGIELNDSLLEKFQELLVEIGENL